MTEHPNYEEDEPVYVLYPLDEDNIDDRSTWHWLPGFILDITTDLRGDIEYRLIVEDERVAQDEPDGTITYPLAFRDATEIKPRKENTQ